MERMEELRYAVWLQSVLRTGNAHTKRIIDHFGSPAAVFYADDSKRLNSGLFTPTELKRCRELSVADADKILECCQRNNISLCAITDPGYPECLKNLESLPPVLYYQGRFPDFDNDPVFCIVGPREVSDFGAKSAYSLARRLALAGFTIVSGCAKGADTAAHRGTLQANGKGVCILPGGILRHPATKMLRNSLIASGGCVLSECSPNEGIFRYSYQARNRLLAALSLGVAVVEAGEHSGALITARYACEFGKDVFVIPGNPTIPQYVGSNALLRDGAKPLLDASDIFGEYLPRFAGKIHLERAFPEKEKPANAENTLNAENISKNYEKFQKKSADPLSKTGKIVYNYLDKQKFTADDLLATGLSEDEILSVLTELEILEYITCLPGGYYALR